jgi:hypothetical protein
MTKKQAVGMFLSYCFSPLIIEFKPIYSAFGPFYPGMRPRQAKPHCMRHHDNATATKVGGGAQAW